MFANHDYEPYAKESDAEIKKFLEENGVGFKTFKDQVIFEKNEVVKDDGDPYVVYTPYKRKWKEAFNAATDLVDYKPELKNCIKHSRLPNLTLSDMGFETSSLKVPDYTLTNELIENYEDTRNYPAKEHGTSRLGPSFKVWNSIG